jgi:VWFA-related protein
MGLLMRIHAFLVLVVLALAGPLSGQTVQGPTFRTGVDILTVDVTVLDSDGRPIDDLGTAEFSVTVDGRPRKIVSLDYISTNGGTRSKTEPAIEPDPHFSTNIGIEGGRLIVIVADQGYLRLGTAPALSKALGPFLDNLTPADRVAYIAIPSPGPAVNFTTDRRAIREAVGRTSGQSLPSRGVHNLGLAEALSIADRVDPIERQSIMRRECEEFEQGSQGRERCEDQVEVQATMTINEMRSRTSRSIAALLGLLQSLAPLDGPKSLVYISEGLMLDSRGEEFNVLASAAARAQVTINVMMLEVSSFDVSIADVPRTPFRDRELHEEGLELLAGMAKGALYRDVGAGAASFNRIQLAMSGYYLLGVEPEAPDRDGRRHEINVEVGRRGAVVRARQEFLFGRAPAGARPPEEIVSEALGSPVALGDVPLTVASYAFQDQGSDKVRVVVAAEVGGPRPASSEYVVGLALTETDGRVVANTVGRIAATPGAEPAAMEFLGALLVEPGTYLLRMAAADSSGRRGSVEHAVQAWKMAGEEFAVGDLMLSNPTADPNAVLKPGVVARLDAGRLAAYTELYAKDPAVLEQAEVRIDVGEDLEGPALVSGKASLVAGPDGQRRAVQAILGVEALPPGKYVARATILSGGRTMGKLTRPFEVTKRVALARTPDAPAGGAPAAGASRTIIQYGGAPFTREAALAPDVVGYYLTTFEQSRASAPAGVRAAIANAKKGQLQGAAREAFEGGDQAAAAFLRGLELYTAGQLDQAATQFRAVIAQEAGSAPATFYLAAAYAAAGRDREAAGFWTRAIPAGPPAAVYTLVADTHLRQGNATLALPALRDGLARFPEDDGLRRRLGAVQLTQGQVAEGLTTLEPYLSRHPEDHEAQLLALSGLYSSLAENPASATPENRARFERLAKAYVAAKGPQAPLVTKWMQSVAK